MSLFQLIVYSGVEYTLYFLSTVIYYVETGMKTNTTNIIKERQKDLKEGEKELKYPLEFLFSQENENEGEKKFKIEELKGMIDGFIIESKSFYSSQLEWQEKFSFAFTLLEDGISPIQSFTNKKKENPENEGSIMPKENKDYDDEKNELSRLLKNCLIFELSLSHTYARQNLVKELFRLCQLHETSLKKCLILYERHQKDEIKIKELTDDKLNLLTHLFTSRTCPMNDISGAGVCSDKFIHLTLKECQEFHHAYRHLLNEKYDYKTRLEAKEQDKKNEINELMLQIQTLKIEKMQLEETIKMEGKKKISSIYDER